MAVCLYVRVWSVNSVIEVYVGRLVFLTRLRMDSGGNRMEFFFETIQLREHVPPFCRRRNEQWKFERSTHGNSTRDIRLFPLRINCNHFVTHFDCFHIVAGDRLGSNETQNPFNRLSTFSWIILIYFNEWTRFRTESRMQKPISYKARVVWAACAFNLSMVLVANKVLIHHRHAMWHAHKQAPNRKRVSD